MIKKLWIRTIAEVHAITSKSYFYRRAFVAISLVMGVAFVFTTPPLWGLDEISHFARTYQIADGQIRPVTTPDLKEYGGKFPTNLTDLGDYVISDLQDNKKGGYLNRDDITNRAKYDQLTSKQFNDEEKVFTWTATYPPTAYIGNASGAFLANLFNLPIGWVIMFARLGGLLVYILIVYGALRLLKATSKLKPLIFTIALIPTALFQASTVNVDGLAIALGLLFVSAFFTLLSSDKKTKQFTTVLLVLLAVAGVMLTLTKVNYFLLVFAILFLPGFLFKDRRREWLYKIGTLGVCAFPAIVWALINRTGMVLVSQRPDGLPVSPKDQIIHMLQQPLDGIIAIVRTLVKYGDAYFTSSFGVLGSSGASPIVVIVSFAFLVIVALLYARPIFTELKKYSVMLFVIGAVCFVSVLIALYLAFNPVGGHMIDGVQGRYFLPILIPLLALPSLLIPLEVKVKTGSLAIFLACGVSLLLLVSYIGFWLTL